MSSLTSTRGQAMLGYLPPMYQTSMVMKSLLQAEGTEMDSLRQALSDTLNQWFVNTATWGLTNWEQELGIVPAQGATDQQRRDTITSRLRGYGTATLTVVKGVAESYQHGSVRITEDFAAYKVTIQFISPQGVPSNMSDLQAAVRAVLPAHLDVIYTYYYFTWDLLDAHNYTWDQWDARALTWDQTDTAQ